MASPTDVNVPVSKPNGKTKVTNFFKRNKDVIKEWAEISSIHGIPHAAAAGTTIATVSRYDEMDFPAVTVCHSSPYSAKKIGNSDHVYLKNVIQAYKSLNN
uniref:Ovule protein n=1 Tax=Parastrongyloides trichosuri TaxID=131310 RepID=A0A0N4ZY78_PARTI